MTTKWDSAWKRPGITLSNGDMTCAGDGGTSTQLVRSTTSRSSGSVYFEITGQSMNNNDPPGIGILGADIANNGCLYDPDGLQFNPMKGYILAMNASKGTQWPGCGDGTVIGFGFNIDTGVVEIFKNGTKLGPSITGVNVSPVYIGACCQLFYGTYTLNPSPASVPSGYVSWDAPVISKSWLMTIYDGVKKGIKGIAKGSLPVFDGNKWGVLESSGAAGQVLTTAADGTLSWGFPDIPVYATASEALAAYALVSVYTQGGILYARNADATNADKPAFGFAVGAVSNAGAAAIHRAGLIVGTGLTPGNRYYLSQTVAGGYALSIPFGVGGLIQYIGTAISTTQILFEKSEALEVI